MVTYLHVRAISQSSSLGRLCLGDQHYPCWLGRNGLAHRKREGDGKTPIGVWFLDQCYFRPDRLKPPPSGLKFVPLQRNMGWCETPVSAQYNQQVRLPFPFAHESMWREDGAYDIVISTTHNKRPRIRGFGSAIFFHLLREGGSHTAGCIALRMLDMRKVLARCGVKTALVLWPPGGGITSLPQKVRCPP